MPQYIYIFITYLIYIFIRNAKQNSLTSWF